MRSLMPTALVYMYRRIYCKHPSYVPTPTHHRQFTIARAQDSSGSAQHTVQLVFKSSETSHNTRTFWTLIFYYMTIIDSIRTVMFGPHVHSPLLPTLQHCCRFRCSPPQVGGLDHRAPPAEDQGEGEVQGQVCKRQQSEDRHQERNDMSVRPANFRVTFWCVQ